MKLGSKLLLGAVGMTVLSLGAITFASPQADISNAVNPNAKKFPGGIPMSGGETEQQEAAGRLRRYKLPVGTADHPLMSDQAFHNIQVFKGIPAAQFMDTMGFFSASLVETCTYCHSDESCGNWDLYAQDVNPIKNEARAMVRMENDINRTYFAGQQVVTCFSCHWGAEEPKSTPSLNVQYGVPETMEPEVIPAQDRNSPAPKVLIDKYIEAMGGAAKVNALKTYSAHGSYQAYSASEQGSVDIFAKAPNQRTIVYHTASGDSATVYDGVHAWQSGPDDLTPLPLVALAGSDLNGFRTDALIFFPYQIMKNLTKLRTGAPFVWHDMTVSIVQGTDPGGALVQLYFDTKTNMLVREVRYIKTIVGTDPYEIDYSDFRDSGGIKTPFHIVIFWTDGRQTTQMDNVTWNGTLPATAFAEPKAPKPEPATAELIQ